MAEAGEVVGAEPEAGFLSLRLLEMCVVTGVPSKTLRQVIQDQGFSVFLEPSPEVLSIHAPPFVGCETRPRPTSHITWRHPEELTGPALPPGEHVPGNELFTERLSIPTSVELCGLPELCFPDGVNLELEMKEDLFHFLVLTDIQGNRQQCVVVHIYREIPIRDAAQPQGPSDCEAPPSLSDATHFFIPYGICLITKFPYYSVLQDSLSCLLLELHRCGESDFEKRVREFAAQLCLVPCPPPGAVQLSYQLGPLCIVLSPPQNPESLVIDIGLHIPFLCFKPQTILQILTCILIERRMVFLSSDWTLLTLVTECFLHFLYPLQWRHSYIPVLANQMLDLVMAPTVFLMGCHRRHLETINEVEDLVLVDIDNGTVLTTQRQLEIPRLPAAAIEEFLSSARELQVNSELASARRPVSTSLAISRHRHRERRHRLNTHIQQLFLHLQGSILRDVSKHLNHKHRMFLKKEFLDSRETTAQPFYSSLLKTDLFHCFLKARLNRKSDAFTRWETTARVRREQGSQRQTLATTTESPRMSGEHSTLGRHNLSLGEETGSEAIAQRGQRRTTKFSGRSARDKAAPRTLALPSFPADPLDYASVASYYTKLIEGISAEIERPGAEALAECFYLRGIVFLAQGRSLQALLDFQKLEKINMNFFPWELVKQTLEAMAPEQMREVQQTEVLKHLIYEMVEKHWDQARQEESVRNYELPKAPLNKQEFNVQIQAAGIINNSKTTDRLFDVLTGGQQKLVDPQTFTEFYTRWTEMKHDTDSITLSDEVTKNLHETERVSKVSNPVKTSCGLGRLALTQKRLFLLTEGHPYYKEIARFQNIEEVESCLPVSVFPLKILALRIKVQDKKEPFVANLKSERDLWKLVIREMMAGKFLADRHKDPQYVQQALSNVQLINVVAKCNLQQRPISMAFKLASLTHSVGEEPPTVPRMTSEALKHTLHFADGSSGLCSVDVLLYVPGTLDPGESPDAHPRLWCALSDGRVVMYNAATWIVDQSPVQVGCSRLNCMVAVGDEQVWVGSEDSSIYIIDAATMVCNRRLAGHRNQVSDMTLEEVTDFGRHARQVYSCSLDGTVVLWDPEAREVKSQFQLPQCWSLTSIAVHHNQLWCCVEYSLLVLSRDGLQLREVKFSPSPSNASVLMTYFLIIPQRDELWTVSCQQPNLDIWKTENPSNPIRTIPLPDCAIVICMIHVKRQVWVGGGVTQDRTKGKIYVIDMDTYSLHKELEASCGLIRAMCSAEDRYILSGTQDSKAVIWKVD